ncbi:MAG: RsmB/NOP family class I SAM-dependent RNA methyltransferase [Bdellovibrionales bacterium]|nr:RsmB/NOP family class I SAM-dependent RNA methyltransferase [Bdellovibrionales bacterium]
MGKNLEKSPKLQDRAAYEEHYQKIYGDRWPALYQALAAPTHHVARFNAFFPWEHPEQTFEHWKSSADKSRFGLGDKYPHLDHALEVDENFNLNDFTTPLLPFYKMDPASILAAQALQVQPGDRVLDMCAAPGGKTLVLIEAMGAEGQMIANELSPQRRFRMMSVIKRYVPESLRSRVDIRGVDGNMFGLKMKESFDRILLDAPCSGDRGLVQKSSELEGWTSKRPKNFAVRQYSLLASAFAAVKSGGRIVYSTCAIAREENDGVIEKLMKKKEGEFNIVRKEWPMGTPTDHGHIVLPDVDKAGPIFFSIIEKN